MWSRGSTSARRTDVRRKLPDFRSQIIAAGKREGVAGSLLIALAFFLLTGGLMLMREEILPYRPGQHVAQDIVSRVDFTYLDKERLRRARQDARDRVIRVYRANENSWERLEAALLDLPDRLATRSVEETPESLRALFHLDTPTFKADLDSAALTALDQARSEKRRDDYADAVHHYVDSLRTLILLPEKDRHDEIKRQEELFRASPKIDLPPAGILEVSRTHPAVPTDYVLSELHRRAVQNFREELQGEIVAFTANTLEPTHVLDEAATAERQNRAAAEVPRSAGLVAYKANQVLKDHDKPVTDSEYEVLKAEQDAFVEALPALAWFRSKLGSVLVVGVLTIAVAAYVKRYQPRVVKNHTRGVAIAGLLVAGLLAAQVTALAEWPLFLFGTAPTIFVAMILSIAYDRRFAMGISSLHAMLVTFALDQDIGFFFVLFVGALTCCFLLKDVRTRSTLVEIGLLTGLAMALTAGAAGFTTLDPIQPAAYVWRSCAYALAGAVSVGFVVQGLLRPIEELFRITTSMTLLERADASQPLLKRLQIEAPGTYNHSLQVATLAEAGAEAIGADALLCRVGAYYHDIGKVNKPEYFVENQFDGVNRHINLSPSVSLLIIIGHVKDGVALAREARLPPSLTPFIQQHHGTTLVEYFYHQARQRLDPSGQPANVSEAQYRYPGPKPRSKEVAIVMLADAVESATRAMKDWTASRIESLVHDMAMKRLLDGQFDECDLTIRELDLIERAMVKALLSIYHGRIAYPPPATATTFAAPQTPQTPATKTA